MSTREARFTAPDLERLMAFSLRLRAFMAMLERNPGKAATSDAQERFLMLCDEARLDLRVTVQLPPGISEPRNDREAIAYMRRERYCASTHWQRTQEHIQRNGAEPRLLLTVDRLVSEARKLGVPLYPQALERAEEVHIGHATERFLPWACWDVISDLMWEAGHASGFHLLPAEVVPGQFRLDPEAPDLPEKPASRRPMRLSPEQASAEREALWAYYSGGQYVPPEFHGEGSGNA